MARLGSGIPLVARSAEMRSLRSALEGAERGEPGVVLLSGDAGVGKTRLLAELAALAEQAGALVLSGRCLDLAEGGLPYLPFAESLGELTSCTEPDVLHALRSRPALARMLPQLSFGEVTASEEDSGTDSGSFGGIERPTRHEQDVGQLQLFDAVSGLLAELTARRTVVILLEDLHWADSSTRALLSFLASRLRKHRLVLAASYRTEDVNRTHPLRTLLTELIRLDTVTRVELEPLHAADARTLVNALSERALDGETSRAIAERGEGNPFFTEELVASSTSGAQTSELPAGLAEMLLARVEGLTEQARAVVRALAVADGPAAHSALAEVTGMPETELDAALRAAVVDHVLVVDGQHYGFRHALLREAVYEDLMPGEHSRLHARYAARLRGMTHKRGDSALLAYHSMHSNDLCTALSASVRAAEEAGEWGGAPGAALRHVEQALRVWDAVQAEQRPGDLDELQLLYRAANYASKAGQPERAIAYARSATGALTADTEPERAARVWRRLAKTLSFQDDTESETAQSIERAWTLVADAEPSVARARVLATRAEVLRGIGGNDHQAEWSARTAVADANAVGAPDAATDALITMAVQIVRSGDPDTGRRRLREAIEQGADSDMAQEELRAWHFLGLSYDDAGEFAEAREIYRKGLERATATGLTWSVWGVELYTRQAVLTHTIGDWPPAGEDDGPQDFSGAVAARTGSGRVQTAVARGRFDEAERMLAAMRPHWRTEVRIAISYVSATVELASWYGRHQRALREARDGISVLEGFGTWQLGGLRLAALGLHACVAIARDDDAAEDADVVGTGKELIEHARECAARGRPHAGTLGPEGRAWLARAEAAAADLQGKGDPRLWAEAVALFGYGAVYEQALCRWHHAATLLDTGLRGDIDTAAEELRAAEGVADRLAARPLAEVVRALARRRGITLAGQPAEQSVRSSLTTRGLAVLEEVAGGRTNRQAGERLYISEKTVSVHLSRLMAKLGASSRAEAVAIAYDRGLLARLHDESQAGG